MSNLEFHVGAQVVCVDDNWQDVAFKLPPHQIHPQIGSIYTIREIVDDHPDIAIGLLLEEIVNEKIWSIWGHGELSWYAWHFRPVKKTDISQFTQILQTLPKKVREPA